MSNPATFDDATVTFELTDVDFEGNAMVPGHIEVWLEPQGDIADD